MYLSPIFYKIILFIYITNNGNGAYALLPHIKYNLNSSYDVMVDNI